MCHMLFASSCKMGPHVYVGPDSAGRIQLPCFPQSDIGASEIRVLEAFSKHGVNDLSKALEWP